jgi:tagatose 6-phosphate kinase
LIIAVCLNPALDITHHVPVVDWAGVNRPTAVFARPGGKGVNVARTLRALGADVMLMGLAGGATGSWLETSLGGLDIATAFIPVGGESRRTFTVVDGRGATALFSEPGPEVSLAEFATFRGRLRAALDGAAAVVLSGSLPPGLPPDAYATLIETAGDAGVPALLDTHGEALRRGVEAGAALVKPNLDELQALTGRRLTALQGIDWAAVSAAARQLRRAGAGAVVVSLGADGLFAITPDGSWRARPPAVLGGNATGAGDAVTAALAHGLVLGQPWEERLRHAVALGAATVAAPVAGEFTPADYAAGLSGATVLPEKTGRRPEEPVR